MRLNQRWRYPDRSQETMLNAVRMHEQKTPFFRLEARYVLAHTEEEDITITAGGAGAFLGRPNIAAIAGSINVHILTNATRATLDIGTRVIAGSIYVSALMKSKFACGRGVAIAGGLGAGSSGRRDIRSQ